MIFMDTIADFERMSSLDPKQSAFYEAGPEAFSA
jgi:hypothetical protein